MSAVYTAAVLEYLCAEVLELAGRACQDNRKRIISPRHILLAVCNDAELNELLRGVTFGQSGVMPRIHEVLRLSTKLRQEYWAKRPVHVPKQL